MANSLHRRLMYLCNLTYALRPGPITMPIRDNGNRDAAIGLRREGLVIARAVAGEPPIHLAVVDRIAEGLVIAVRGTLPPTGINSVQQAKTVARDWLADTNVFPGFDGQAGITFRNGQVHEGFATSALALWQGAPGISTALEQLRAAGEPENIYLTGHSKGGAVATLLATLVKAKFPAAKVNVVTFASARVGDDDFRVWFKNRGIEQLRYEVSRDVVPLLPAGTDRAAKLDLLLNAFGINSPAPGIGFVPVGQVKKDDFSIVEQLNLQAVLAKLTPSKSLIALLNSLLNFHSIDPNTAYDKLVT